MIIAIVHVQVLKCYWSLEIILYEKLQQYAVIYTSAASLPRCLPISKRYDHYNIQSRAFDTSRDYRLVNRHPDILYEMNGSVVFGAYIPFQFYRVINSSHTIVLAIMLTCSDKPSNWLSIAFLV